MLYRKTVNNVMQRPKIYWHNCKLIVNRGFVHSKSVIPNVSHCNRPNKDRFVQPSIPLDKYSFKFSTITDGAKKGISKKTKENIKNYLLMGGMLAYVGLGTYFYKTMRLTRDEVFLEPPEKEK